MSLFTPTLYLPSFSALSVADLKEKGIRAILLDVDNTLTLHNDPNLSKKAEKTLEALKEAGITPIIFSNNKKERVAPFAKKVGLPFLWHAAKPLPFGFSQARKMLGVSKDELCIIGDQLLTDILGGKLAGVMTILVDPLADETKGFLAAKRKFQKYYLRKHRMIPQPSKEEETEA